MYYAIFLAIFLALACPTSHHYSGPRHGSGGGTVTTQDTTTTGIGGDSGGDQGHIPPHH